MIPAIHLIEYADQIYIEESVWSDPDMTKLFGLIVDHIIYTNDYHSYRMELNQQNNNSSKMFNLIPLICARDNCTLEIAFDYVAEKIRQFEEEIWDLEKYLRENRNWPDEIKQFIDKLNYLVGGDFISHIECGRYLI